MCTVYNALDLRSNYAHECSLVLSRYGSGLESFSTDAATAEAAADLVVEFRWWNTRALYVRPSLQRAAAK